jgi:hypothetical protein
LNRTIVSTRALSANANESPLKGYTRSATRVWPTLLSAAAQAAVRAQLKSSDRGADVHTAVIMARTAFDAYLHELFALRNLPRFVKFMSGLGGRARLSKERWRLIADKRRSLSGLSKSQKREYEDVKYPIPKLRF